MDPTTSSASGSRRSSAPAAGAGAHDAGAAAAAAAAAHQRGDGGHQHQQQQQQQQQQPGHPQLPVLDPVTDYEKIHRIGEGTYGVVYKARHIPSGELVALKKVRFDRGREGVPVTSMRELAVLQQLEHPNIVRLLRVVTGSRTDSVFLVFEYCDHDLGRVLDTHSRAFSEGEAKGLFRQLCSAVAYLHRRWVLHRDLKLSNLLYNAAGHLKLCDFGLARHFHPGSGRLTPNVVTLWYRSPELLLGAEHYGPAADCWSLGCVLGELLRGEPLFPASSEAECLRMHCQLLGTPTPRIWPGMRGLPAAAGVRWPDQPYSLLRRAFPELSGAGLDLLNGLLTYDPQRRLSAAQALQHPYFRERPFPRQPEDMPSFPTAPPTGAGAGAGAGAAGGQPLAQAGAKRRAPPPQPSAKARDLERRFGEAFGGAANSFGLPPGGGKRNAQCGLHG